jgi:hypothetical protein
MTLIGRRFGLSIERGSGIFCDESGLFVGGVPMLERSKGRENYRGMGKTVAECMMGRVSQDCGGNRYDV